MSRPTASLGADFEPAVDDRYLDDYIVGATYEYGYVTVGEADIVEFAGRYDPQSFHADPAAAANGPFGGLIASGWHTAALTMRVLVDHYLSHVASAGSPGIDELRWRRPVRPGDILRVRATVEAVRVSESKPDRRIVTTGVEVLNQHDDAVLTLRAINLLLRRWPAVK